MLFNCLKRSVLTCLLCFPAVSFGQSFLPPIAAGPTSTEAGVVNEATVILQELAAGTATQIPENLLASAEGVAIVPHYVRGAFVIGVAGGRGVLVMRDTNHNWQAPELITIGGGSIGWQAGVQSTDLVLVFRSPRSLNNMRLGKLTLGVNASAAAGPVGRFASAGTDLSAQAEIFTYSKTRGLFAGVALDGASVQIDVPATQAYYQTLGGGPGVVPQSAISLINELNLYSQTVPVVAVDASVSPIAGRSGATISIPVGGLANLETAVSALIANVDEEWKNYLGLPAQWRGASELSADQVYATLARYERVATNPQFAALRSLPSFSDAIRELQGLASRAPQTHNLRLPPPPIVDSVDVPAARY